MKINDGRFSLSRRLQFSLQRPASGCGMFVFIGMLAITSFANAQQADKTEGNRTSESVSAASDANATTGITRYKGVMYFVKEGHAQRVRGKLDLSEGVTVKDSGQIIFRTRQSTALREGEVFYLNGVVRPVSAEIRSAVETLVAQGRGTRTQREPR